VPQLKEVPVVPPVKAVSMDPSHESTRFCSTRESGTAKKASGWVPQDGEIMVESGQLNQTEAILS
jgi:hypothetical protein